MSWRAGTEPGSPMANPMMAAEDAVVCAMLFSSMPKPLLELRLNVEKNAKAKRAAVMLPPSMKDVLRPV
jgi:hypothetical protein